MSRFDFCPRFETMSVVDGWITRWHFRVGGSRSEDRPPLHIEQQPSIRIEIGTLVDVRFEQIFDGSDDSECVAQVRASSDVAAFYMMPLKRKR